MDHRFILKLNKVLVLCTVSTLHEIANSYHVSTTHKTKALLLDRINLKTTFTSRNM